MAIVIVNNNAIIVITVKLSFYCRCLKTAIIIGHCCYYCYCHCCLETAINIGYCCKLLSDDLEEIYIIDGDTDPTVEEQLSKAKEDMFKKMAIARLSNGEGDGNGTAMDADVVYSVDMPLPVDSALNLPEDFGGFAIIINGHSLVSVYNRLILIALEQTKFYKLVLNCAYIMYWLDEHYI